MQNALNMSGSEPFNCARCNVWKERERQRKIQRENYAGMIERPDDRASALDSISDIKTTLSIRFIVLLNDFD